MGRKISDYKKALKVLEKLEKDYPSFGLGRHFETIRENCGDMWGTSHKEFLFQLEKYQATLELDKDNIASEDYVDRVIRDADNFDELLKDNYEED